MYNEDSNCMKLANISDKYLTNIDDKAKMKSKVYSKNQKVLYNIQGELMVDDKCLTSDISGNDVYFDECRKDKNQAWQLYDDKIVLSEDKSKCLTSDNTQLKVTDCDNKNEMQSWNVEHPDVNKSTDYILPKYKGKMVVLVDSDHPWYLNNDTTIPMAYSNKFNDYSNQCGNFDIAPEVVSCNDKGTEHFTDNTDNTDNKENKTQTHIILLLIAIVIIMVVYKVYSKNQI
jgi:Ricin-type beta-trefoil lectin domain